MKTFKEILGSNYKDGLTAEQIEEMVCASYEALLKNESKLKTTVSNANSEAADWKKKYQETLTEEEKKRVAREEELNNLIQERDSLKKDKTISEHYANLVSLGYDENLAKETATAMYDNDYQKVFENQRAFLSKQSELIQANNMKNNPTPPAGDPKNITKDDFEKLSYGQMVELQKSNPTLYNELIKNE